MGSIHRNGILRRPNDNHSGILRRSNDVTRIITSTVIGVVFGFFVGISFQNFSVTKISLPTSLLSSIDAATINGRRSESTTQSFPPKLGSDENKSSGTYSSGDSSKVILLAIALFLRSLFIPIFTNHATA
ncbi:uncharacterized protein LOC131225710 [Magnolia sinica]|uniref:uncharacterized protein LOC131225710 n=1 Tax=Magnolia sinica TaxID=86752 RepID=UPI002657E5D4|nr:uncharacterized protein LOC131225709 isoform X2 [Magnolia sinica]XP_058077269.1 uncharacterized protein LOC131225710 [Magnolia sinica]